MVILARTPTNEDEIILADKAYCSSTSNLLYIVAPKKKPRNGCLTGRDQAFNELHAFYRVTVEHSIGFLKRFRISHNYRGNIFSDLIS